MRKGVKTIKENGILSNDNVDVEIEPDVKSNKVDVNIQLCSCSLTLLFSCFSRKLDKDFIENQKQDK